MSKNSFRAIALAACLIYFLFPVYAAAANIRLAVLYPEVDQPYAGVFQEIISGIRGQRNMTVHPYAVKEGFNASGFTQWLDRQNADALVVLGRRGVNFATALQVNIPVFVGAVLYVGEPKLKSAPGISLTPDPKLLFQNLKQLAPKVERILAVYNPERYSWLIKHASAAAKKLNVQLVAEPATGLSEAAQIYRRYLAQSQSGKDAIWLMQDATTVGERSVLPLILREAWQKKLLIFSSNPSHVRRGALFSLYADRKKLGRSIGKLVTEQVRSNKKQDGLLPLTDVHIAVNLRTAGHIELTIPYNRQRQFDLVFPKP
jgi:putative ABC transport system substrate-binding protein